MNPIRTVSFAKCSFTLVATITMALFGDVGVITQDATDQPSDEVQIWSGSLDLGAAKLRIQVNVTTKDGVATAMLVSPDQSDEEIAPDQFELTAKKMSFQVKRLDATFEGTLDASKTKIVGEFVQRGSTIPLTLEIVNTDDILKVVEAWKGTLVAGGRTLELQFRILESNDGTQSVVWDSLTESVRDMPAERTIEDDTVTFAAQNVTASFVGTYNEDKSALEGNWTQGGAQFPMTMNKVDLEDLKSDATHAKKSSKPIRPQTPKAPFPYQSTDVNFENLKDSVTLAGTLTIPKGDGPFPAVVLINGSGAHDRNVSLFGHQLFLVVADHLSRNGIAVLRYDERGVGDSTGDITTATSVDLSRDVAAAVDYLKTLENINHEQIGLYGHSEGGLIAPMLAIDRDDIAWIVMAAGPGVPGKDIVRNQSQLITRAAGVDEKLIAIGDELNKAVFAAVEANVDADEAEVLKQVEIAFDASVSQLTDEQKKLLGNTKAQRAQLNSVCNPWFRFFLTYDPADALQKLKCPVLVLNGEKDLQVDPELNIPAIKDALKVAGNEQAEFHVLPNLNHLLQTCQTGSPSEYATIEETIAPSVLTLVTDWINKQAE